tara:strand:+ start:3510 stop:3998 length:489 start_codon:yes stop_codon:yes gene_type:complete
MHLLSLARLFAFLAMLFAPLVHAGQVSVARDLREDGTLADQEGVPILLFYTASYCHYCEAIKTEFLDHMAGDPVYQSRALFREVRVNSAIQLVNFDGSSTTHHHFADQRPITLVPTLEFVDASGVHLAEPMIGARIPDFYGAYVDQGIENALKKLRIGRDAS